MKKFIAGFLGVFLVVFLTNAQKPNLPIIGSYEGKNVRLNAYILQDSPAADFLILRGGNFLNNSKLARKADFPDISKFLINESEGDGLGVPDLEEIPALVGYKEAWFYDVNKNEVGVGYATLDFNYENSKNNEVFRVFKRANKAIRQLKTNPVIITLPPVDPPENDCFNGKVVAEWLAGNSIYKLKAAYFNEMLWLTQQNEESLEFIVRGWNMLERDDVVTIYEIPNSCIKGGLQTGVGGLANPSEFTVPDGYEEFERNGEKNNYRPKSTGVIENPNNPPNGGRIGNFGDVKLREIDVFATVADSPTKHYFAGISEFDKNRVKQRVSLPDFLPVWGIAANLLNNKYKFGSFEQVVFPEDSKVNEYTHEGVKYYVRPTHNYSNSEFAYDLESFPDLKAPSNKLFINACNFYEYKDTGLLKRVGGTYVTRDLNPNIKQNERSMFISDGWLISLGMPEMYKEYVTYKGSRMKRQDAFDQWCRDIDANELLKSFKRTFQPHANDGHIEWNAEDNISVWTVERWKIENCFRWWGSQGFTAKFAAWGQAPYSFQRIIWEGSNKKVDFNNLPHRDGDNGANLWMSDFFRNINVWEVGDYITRFDNDGYIHHLLTEYLANSKVRKDIGKPDVKIVATAFANLEFNVGDYMQGNVITRTGKGGVKYNTFTKAQVFPATMFNTACWMLTVADGVHLWDTPFFYLSEKSEIYGEGWIPDLNKLYSEFFEGHAQDFRETRKNINYFYWGLHAVTTDGNREIIEDKSTEWIMPMMPDVAHFEKKTLVAWKKSQGKTLALVMAHPSAGNSTRTERVAIDGKEYNILLHGQWTSVIRL